LPALTVAERENELLETPNELVAPGSEGFVSSRWQKAESWREVEEVA
jgi:hypothetical protein